MSRTVGLVSTTEVFSRESRRSRAPGACWLERVRTHRNADKRGTFRRYNDYRLPERLGGGVVTVRLHDFEVLYKRRNDAESINRHLDDTLWLRRAHSVGARRQLLNLITYAMG